MTEIDPPTPADLAAIRGTHQPFTDRTLIPLPHGDTPVCQTCMADFPCDTARALTALDAARAALRTIRDQYGQVCAEYDSCNHAVCRSSYSAWATAASALRSGAAVAADGAEKE